VICSSSSFTSLALASRVFSLPPLSSRDPTQSLGKERSETKIEALQLATGDAFRPFERDGTFLFSPPDLSLRRRAENEAPAALDGGDDDDDDFSSFLNPNHLSSFSLL
jgi:hypothetical protein